MESIIKLFNQLSQYKTTSNPNGLSWAYDIAAIQSVRDITHRVGVRVIDIR